MSKKKKKSASAPARAKKQTQTGKIPPKTMAIISVCAIILGIMITAHDYLEKHTNTVIEAQTVTNEALADLSSVIPDYVKDVLKTDASETSAVEELTAAAENLCSEDIGQRSEAYRQVAASYETLSGKTSSETMEETLNTVEESAVNYNREVQKLNEKVVKFPYNIVAKIAGYKVYPLFGLNE